MKKAIKNIYNYCLFSTLGDGLKKSQSSMAVAKKTIDHEVTNYALLKDSCFEN